MTWMMPLDASMSAVTTVASFTMTIPPSTAIETTAPPTVATLWPSRVTTTSAGAATGSTW